jgi:hypothetical protein
MSEERLPGESEDEFVAGDYDVAVTNAIVLVADSQVTAMVKRTRTFLTSEIPVRSCTDTYPLRSWC